jgi:capsular polysaccharide biosynthesis protein
MAALRRAFYTGLRLGYRAQYASTRALRALSFGRLGRPPLRLRRPIATIECAEAWFRARREPGYRFLPVDPAAPTEVGPLPRTVENHVHRVFREGRVDPWSPTWVAELPAGRIWGQCGAVITPDDELLAEPSVAFGQKSKWGGRHPALSAWRPWPVHELDGTAVVLTTDGAGALYYHWMLQLLPRIELLRRAGVDLDTIDYFVVNSVSRDYERESLARVGVPLDRVVSSAEHPHIRAARLIVPSVPLYGGHIRRWMCSLLRDQILPPDAARQPASGRRYYIARSDASYRRVRGEAAVIDLLGGYGFTPLEMTDLSLAEQAAAMAEAEVVVAPHGGGLTNIVFCSPGARVLELFSPELVPLYYWKIACCVGADYAYVLGRGARADDQQSYDARADIDVDLDKLRRALTEIIGL